MRTIGYILLAVLFVLALAPSIFSDGSPPTQPTNLANNSVSMSQINLSWSPSTDNDTITYLVYRDSTKIGETANTWYLDELLNSSTQYTYIIGVRDNFNNEGPNSTSLTVSTLAGMNLLEYPSYYQVENTYFQARIERSGQRSSQVSWLRIKNATTWTDNLIYPPTSSKYGLNYLEGQGSEGDTMWLSFGRTDPTVTLSIGSANRTQNILVLSASGSAGDVNYNTNLTFYNNQPFFMISSEAVESTTGSGNGGMLRNQNQFANMVDSSQNYYTQMTDYDGSVLNQTDIRYQIYNAPTLNKYAFFNYIYPDYGISLGMIFFNSTDHSTVYGETGDITQSTGLSWEYQTNFQHGAGLHNMPTDSGYRRFLETVYYISLNVSSERINNFSTEMFNLNKEISRSLSNNQYIDSSSVKLPGQHSGPASAVWTPYFGVRQNVDGGTVNESSYNSTYSSSGPFPKSYRQYEVLIEDMAHHYKYGYTIWKELIPQKTKISSWTLDYNDGATTRGQGLIRSVAEEPGYLSLLSNSSDGVVDYNMTVRYFSNSDKLLINITATNATSSSQNVKDIMLNITVLNRTDLQMSFTKYNFEDLISPDIVSGLVDNDDKYTEYGSYTWDQAESIIWKDDTENAPILQVNKSLPQGIYDLKLVVRQDATYDLVYNVSFDNQTWINWTVTSGSSGPYEKWFYNVSQPVGGNFTIYLNDDDSSGIGGNAWGGYDRIEFFIHKEFYQIDNSTYDIRWYDPIYGLVGQSIQVSGHSKSKMYRDRLLLYLYNDSSAQAMTDFYYTINLTVWNHNGSVNSPNDITGLYSTQSLLYEYRNPKYLLTRQGIKKHVFNRSNIEVLTLSPDSAEVTPTILNWTDTIFKINISSQTPENPLNLSIYMGAEKANINYTIKLDGAKYDSAVSNSTGWLNWRYNVSGNEWSNHVFTFTEVSPFYTNLATNTSAADGKARWSGTINNMDSTCDTWWIENNNTGIQVNSSKYGCSGATYNLQYNITLNDTMGNLVRWRVWSNNSDANLRSSDWQSIILTQRETPQILWISPTPDDNQTLSANYVTLNTSIIDGETTSAFFDWDESLVAYWSMDYYNSTGVKDNSTYTRFGDFNGGMGTSNIKAGRFGSALDFDGSNDYVTSPDNQTVSGLSAITVSAWIKPDIWPTSCTGGGGSCYNFIVAKSNWADNREWRIRYESTSNVVVWGVSSTGSGVSTASIPISDLPVGGWHQLTGTWDSTSGEAKVYLDGMLKDSTTLTASSLYDGSAKLSIGSSGNDGGGGTTDNFDGMVDEVRIWNRVLSSEEINASYNNSKYRLYNNFTSLSDGSYNYSAYAIDSSGNMNITPARSVRIDTSVPTTYGHSPAPGTTKVEPSTNITVHVNDSADGVNQTTINMTVNGVQVSPTITGTPQDYTLVYDPPSEFNNGEVVNVTIYACDLAIPSHCMDTESYSFTIKTPIINVWNGLNQRFGIKGTPQNWINILGNVSDPVGIKSLSYRLNGGSEITLSVGSDSRRLWSTGDFNVDINITDLINGSNTLVINATNNDNDQVNKTVTIDYNNQTTWSLPYSIDWGAVTDIQDVVQIVDGEWGYDSNGIRSLVLGYDRVVAIGDVAWGDYEILVPVTIHGLDPDPAAFQFPSVSPSLAITYRWTGHTDAPVVCTQPHCGWEPYGASVSYSWPSYDSNLQNASDGTLKLGGENGGTNVSSKKLEYNTTFYLKFRVETPSSGIGLYSVKVWNITDPEPSQWDLTLDPGPGDLSNGSLLLVLHHVNATFGDILVSDLNYPYWSYNKTNQSMAGAAAEFSVYWEDLEGLSGYIFGSNNTGTWVNDSWQSFSGTGNWSNITKGLNSTAGVDVVWRVWANDTGGHWNSTGSLSVRTTILYDSRDLAPPSTQGIWSKGETVRINGSGWGITTIIRVNITYPNGSSTDVERTADENGEFKDTSVLTLYTGDETGTYNIYVSTDSGATWVRHDTFQVQDAPEFPVGGSAALLAVLLIYGFMRNKGPTIHGAHRGKL